MKAGFLSLLDELSQYGRTAVLRRTDQGFQLMVVDKPPFGKQRIRIPLILFSATIIAVFLDGFLRLRYNLFSDPLVTNLSIGSEIEFAALYVLSLLGILGVHELGHKVASKVHKMNSSWPYFIPGLPSIWPTFGAVISARDAPPNRDALFDLGLSGPVAGLAITVLVSIIAAMSVQLIPATAFPAGTTFGSGDFFTSFLIGIAKPSSGNQIIAGPIFDLLYFAYSLGFFVTFINLLPAWQLDGGHIANSAVSPKVHRILTFASVILMFAAGLFLMALLILFMSGRTPSLRPLDDVSPLSRNRKVLFILTWVLAASIGAFVIYNNPIFSPFLFKL